MTNLNFAGATVLVTGASSGLGEEFAKQLSQKGAHVILVARREEKLRALAEQMGPERATVIVSDLSAPGAAQLVYEKVKESGLSVDHLINNAGSGRAAPFVRESSSALSKMLRLNCEALTELTRLFLPEMVEKGSGGVLQVASMVAMNPCPYQATYAATKAYVLSLTEALAVELAGTGVRMTALCPGHVRTGFQVAAGFSTNALPVPGEISVQRTVTLALQAYQKRKTVVVPGLINRLGAFFGALLPRSFVARTSARMVLKLGRFE